MRLSDGHTIGHRPLEDENAGLSYTRINLFGEEHLVTLLRVEQREVDGATRQQAWVGLPLLEDDAAMNQALYEGLCVIGSADSEFVTVTIPGREGDWV